MSRTRAARLRLTIAVSVTVCALILLAVGPVDAHGRHKAYGSHTWRQCVAAVWKSGQTTDYEFQRCDRAYPKAHHVYRTWHHKH